MFESLIRELENLNHKKISVPINADAEGYLDKECPSKECLFVFKAKEEDWKNLFKDEAVYCPMCGHNAPADSFWTIIGKVVFFIIKISYHYISVLPRAAYLCLYSNFNY